MSSSVKLFKIKRGFENFCDFFKNLFSTVGNFFTKIIYHPKTEEAGIKIKKVRNKVFQNWKENTQNWKHRNLDDHGFSIEDGDI
ncbi:Uncharacterised protein [uncultured archaeon]|nr:Uncharacterised protein [uncultured archaeon]